MSVNVNMQNFPSISQKMKLLMKRNDFYKNENLMKSKGFRTIKINED
jgi:hypothetical protein